MVWKFVNELQEHLQKNDQLFSVDVGNLRNLMVRLITFGANVINPMFAIGWNEALGRKVFYIFNERQVLRSTFCYADMHQHFSAN